MYTYKLLVANGSDNLTAQMNNYSKEGWCVDGNHQVTHYLNKEDKDVFQYTQIMSFYTPDEKSI